MRKLEIVAKLLGVNADDAFRLLSSFEEWPACSPVIKSVQITARRGDAFESAWKVAFLEGTLTWIEEDFFDLGERTCRFRQIEGDVESMSGHWSLTPTSDGCQFRFVAEFDLGLPSLSEIIEPIAEEELRDNLRSVLSGMFGSALEFAPPAEIAPLAHVPLS